MVTLIEGMVQLNIPIPEELREKLDDLVIKRCGYKKRGILGEVVTEAIREYTEKRLAEHTHAHKQQQQRPKKEDMETKEFSPTNYSVSSKKTNVVSAKYNNLIETIKRFSNSDSQITTGLAKKAIKETIGRDERTIDKYLKILLENDILYPDAKLGIYEVQSWVLDDHNLPNRQQPEFYHIIEK